MAQNIYANIICYALARAPAACMNTHHHQRWSRILHPTMHQPSSFTATPGNSFCRAPNLPKLGPNLNVRLLPACTLLFHSSISHGASSRRLISVIA